MVRDPQLEEGLLLRPGPQSWEDREGRPQLPGGSSPNLGTEVVCACACVYDKGEA